MSASMLKFSIYVISTVLMTNPIHFAFASSCDFGSGNVPSKQTAINRSITKVQSQISNWLESQFRIDVSSFKVQMQGFKEYKSNNSGLRTHSLNVEGSIVASTTEGKSILFRYHSFQDGQIYLAGTLEENLYDVDGHCWLEPRSDSYPLNAKSSRPLTKDDLKNGNY